MKQFNRYLLKTLQVFVALVLVVFLLKLIIFIGADSVYIKNNELKKIKDIDVGIFGHSQSQMAIDENHLNDRSSLIFENFSVSANPLYYTCTIIQKFISANKDIVIVIEIGSNNLDDSGMIKSVFERENHFNYHDYFFYTLFDKDSKFLLSNPSKYLIEGSFNFPLINFEGTRGDSSKINKAYENHKNRLIKLKEEWRNPYNEDLEFNRLIKLIRKNKLTNFILIRVPEHKLNKKYYPNYDLRFNYLISLLEKDSNVKIKDYIDFNLSDDSFRDFNHLSIKGRKIFTEYFLKDNFINYDK